MGSSLVFLYRQLYKNPVDAPNTYIAQQVEGSTIATEQNL